MKAKEFETVFGSGDARDASDLLAKRLRRISAGKTLERATGFGTFCHGFISVASLREEADLGKWRRWLPTDSFVYASTCFGMLYVAVGETMWLVNTQTGSILPTEYALDDAILKAASQSTRDALLEFPLFMEWHDGINELGAGNFLAPNPPLIFGGAMAPVCLKQVSADEYLRMTADMFDDEGRNAVSIMRPED
jgi:hypothetical protein